MFLILFYIKNFVKSNSYSYYSTCVPHRKTLTVYLCKTSASLARRITPAALQLSASAHGIMSLLPARFKSRLKLLPEFHVQRLPV